MVDDIYKKAQELDAGLYVSNGFEFKPVNGLNKSLSLDSAEGWGLQGGTVNLQALAVSVSSMFATLDKRRAQFCQIPHRWVEGDNEMDEPPFGLDAVELSRIDKAIRLCGVAYYHKIMNVGGGINSLAWLNPSTITPYTSAGIFVHAGVEMYNRQVTTNTRINGQDTTRTSELKIPADFLLRFEWPEMEEYPSGSSAGRSVSTIASVINAIDELSVSGYGENNGLPIYLIFVPSKGVDAIKPDAARKIESRFQMLMNRTSNYFGGKNKSMAVKAGIEIQRLSLTPDELNTVGVSEAKTKEMKEGLGVAPELISGASNRATLDRYAMMFNMEVGTVFQWVAGQINKEPHFKDQNIRLIVEPEKHPVMMEMEKMRFEMVQILVGSGESIQNAYRLARVQLPDDYDQNEAPEQNSPSQEGSDAMVDEFFAEAQRAKAFYSKGKRSREFQSEILSDQEIEWIKEGHSYP